jgi:hypothetical protein
VIVVVGFFVLFFILRFICVKINSCRNKAEIINVPNVRQNQQTLTQGIYRPTTISDTFEEMRSHRPRIESVHHCPPPAYDKIALDLPPSYDSIQK